jgi:hypothetical protein
MAASEDPVMNFWCSVTENLFTRRIGIKRSGKLQSIPVRMVFGPIKDPPQMYLRWISLD